MGRALGPSILDLTESNPQSRLRTSEFRNLQGLRNALRNDIERGLLRADPIQKVILLVAFLDYIRFGLIEIKQFYFIKNKNKKITVKKIKTEYLQHKTTNEIKTNKKRIKRRIIIIRKKSHRLKLAPITKHSISPLDADL